MSDTQASIFSAGEGELPRELPTEPGLWYRGGAPWLVYREEGDERLGAFTVLPDGSWEMWHNAAIPKGHWRKLSAAQATVGESHKPAAYKARGGQWGIWDEDENTQYIGVNGQWCENVMGSPEVKLFITKAAAEDYIATELGESAPTPADGAAIDYKPLVECAAVLEALWLAEHSGVALSVPMKIAIHGALINARPVVSQIASHFRPAATVKPVQMVKGPTVLWRPTLVYQRGDRWAITDPTDRDFHLSSAGRVWGNSAGKYPPDTWPTQESAEQFIATHCDQQGQANREQAGANQ